MFIHGMTGKEYYSVREKINHYTKKLKDKNITPKQKEHARKRIEELKKLDERAYSDPTIIVTNDKRLGNPIDKPRACVVIGTKGKNWLRVSPIVKRTTKAIILDNDMERQVDHTEKYIDKSEVYEAKDIDTLKELTKNDRNKIRYIHKK